MRTETALAAGQWDIPCPVCGGPAGAAGDARADLQSAERVRHVEARRGDGRREPGPPVRHPDGRAALQHRAGPSAVGLQRVLGCVPHLLPELPAGRARRRCTRTARRSATTSTSTTWSTPTCLALDDERAVGRVFNVGGGERCHHQGVRRRRHAAVRLRRAGRRHRRVPLRRYPPHPVGRVARCGRWDGHRGADAADSVAAYAEWLDGMPGLDGVLADANARMRALGVVAEGGGDEGVPACGGGRQPAQADHRRHTEVHGADRRPADARPLARCAGRRGRRRSDGQPPPPRRDVWPSTSQTRPGRPVVRLSYRAGAARERRHAGRQPEVGRGRGVLPRLQRRQPHQLRSAFTRRRFTRPVRRRRR